MTVATQKGERTVSTGLKDLKEAKALAKKANVRAIEEMSKAGALSQQLIRKLVVGGSITIEQAISEWTDWINSSANSDRTAGNHTMYVGAWARETGTLRKHLTDITEKDLSKWINADDGAKYSSRTVRLASLRSLFRFCSIRQYITYDPSRAVGVKANLLTHEQKEPRQKSCFTDAEIKKILKHIRQTIEDALAMAPSDRRDKKLSTANFWYCATIIGRYSGLRLGDICSLEWAALEKPGKMIVWCDKHDKRVEIPVTPDLANGTESILCVNEKRCFPEQDHIARSKQRAKLSVQFSRILEACEIYGHSFHDLRHSFVTDCRNKGIPMPHISKLVGHSNESTTEGYVH